MSGVGGPEAPGLARFLLGVVVMLAGVVRGLHFFSLFPSLPPARPPLLLLLPLPGFPFPRLPRPRQLRAPGPRRPPPLLASPGACHRLALGPAGGEGGGVPNFPCRTVLVYRRPGKFGVEALRQMSPRGFVHPTWASKDCKPWVRGGKGGGGGGNDGALEAGRRAVPSDLPRSPAGGADGIFFRPPEEVQPPESSLLASLMRACPERAVGVAGRPGCSFDLAIFMFI